MGLMGPGRAIGCSQVCVNILNKRSILSYIIVRRPRFVLSKVWEREHHHCYLCFGHACYGLKLHDDLANVGALKIRIGFWGGILN